VIATSSRSHDGPNAVSERPRVPGEAISLEQLHVLAGDDTAKTKSYLEQFLFLIPAHLNHLQILITIPTDN
jgi:hypothetical protein